MLLHDAAGRAATELLIEEGRLVPDFWLRAEAQSNSDFRSAGYDALNNQVANAVQFAMGKAGVELPEWACPETGAPDYVWIYPEWRKNFPSTEPYYCPGDMFRVMKKCYDGSELPYRDEKKLLDTYFSVSWRTWRRILPHINPDASQNLVDIEMERGNNGNTYSKAARINHILSGAMIRDGALYDFYAQQGEEGLKQIFKGIGRKAVLGVGALLFMSGEHDDLVQTAEALEDVLTI